MLKVLHETINTNKKPFIFRSVE